MIEGEALADGFASDVKIDAAELAIALAKV
jgi:hypothetical protein